MMPRIVAEKAREVERRAHGHVGSCPEYALLTSQGKATKLCRDEFRKRVGMIIERTLPGEARRETCKDRVAERKRLQEKRRARIERGAGDVPEEPGTEMMSRWRFDMRTHLAGYIVEN